MHVDRLDVVRPDAFSGHQIRERIERGLCRRADRHFLIFVASISKRCPTSSDRHRIGRGA
jgi:hypothetical protein